MHTDDPPQPGAGGLRLTAEWEPQSAILMAWPGPDDYGPLLPAVHQTYRSIIAAVRARQPVILAVDDVTELIPLTHAFAGEQAEHPIQLLQLSFGSTRVRDTGPLTVVGSTGPAWVDFRFAGWDDRRPGELEDDLVAQLLANEFLPDIPCHRIDLALSGGAIDSDGQGTVLTTWRALSRCFPGQSRDVIEKALLLALGIDRVLWLDSGQLQGDFADGQVDMLARFASANTIVYQGCDRQDDPHFEWLGDMRAELESMRTRDDRPYRLIELPLPEPQLGLSQNRLPASYASFLIINDAVVVPIYRDPADEYALQMVAMAFPGLDILGVDCRSLIQQGGSLHSLTWHLAEGAFR